MILPPQLPWYCFFLPSLRRLLKGGILIVPLFLCFSPPWLRRDLFFVKNRLDDFDRLSSLLLVVMWLPMRLPPLSHHPLPYCHFLSLFLFFHSSRFPPNRCSGLELSQFFARCSCRFRVLARLLFLITPLAQLMRCCCPYLHLPL